MKKSLLATDIEEQKYGSGYLDDELNKKVKFPQPTFQLEEKSEFMIFWQHFYAILFRRFFWAMRDFRALCFQVFLPGYFAAVGLGILELVSNTENPSLELSVSSEFYSSDYQVPFTNISDNEVFTQNNQFVSNEWLTIYDQYMADTDGAFQYYNFENNTNNISYGNVTDFQTILLDNWQTDNDQYHYNAFYTPLTTSGSNNSIQVGLNASNKHSFPIAFNVLSNWILKYYTTPTAKITIYTEPLPSTQTQKAFDDSLAGILASLFLMISFAFIPVGSIYNIVNDRSQLTKHQQLVSGMSIVSYWIGNLVADIISAIPACLIVIALIHIFGVSAFTGSGEGAFVAVLFLYTFSILPFTYLLSFAFKAPDRAQTVTGTLYLVLGMILLIVSYILDLINDDTKDINKHLKDLYRVFPTFLMADGVFNIALKPVMNPNKGYWHWDVVGKDLTYMAIEGLGYFLLMLVVEFLLSWPGLLRYVGWTVDVVESEEDLRLLHASMDEDVRNEKNRISSYLIANGNETQLSSDCTDTVVLAGLRKVYKGTNGMSNAKVAVRNVYLGVPQGQVFGYLGVNGAGKTTTLACLTGERFASGGNAFVHGISINNQNMLRRFIGYCPQFDALFDLLTGKEHLTFYAMIKGLRGKELESQVDLLLTVLSLQKYKNRRAGTYSGGNKRKLSVAISMIGNPPVVFLDEPSTGMDPMARRHMWEFIRETMNGRCVILTTHSMEECEALCHKLGIMVSGEFKCLGTPQHLKSRFGKGYQLDLTLNDDNKDTTKVVISELKKYFERLKLIEHNQTKLTFELEMEGKKMSLAEIFEILEKLKTNLPIVSYALNQTTLEQIFIRMANKHNAKSEF